MRDIDLKLKEGASRLRLTYTRDHLEELLEQAVAAKMTPRETLSLFFDNEIAQRDLNRARLWMMGLISPQIPPRS